MYTYKVTSDEIQSLQIVYGYDPATTSGRLATPFMMNRLSVTRRLLSRAFSSATVVRVGRASDGRVAGIRISVTEPDGASLLWFTASRYRR